MCPLASPHSPRLSWTYLGIDALSAASLAMASAVFDILVAWPGPREGAEEAGATKPKLSRAWLCAGRLLLGGDGEAWREPPREPFRDPFALALALARKLLLAAMRPADGWPRGRSLTPHHSFCS